MTRRELKESDVVSELEERQAWLAFASAALSGLGGNPKKKFDAVLDDAVALADEMIEEYLERFEPGYERPDDEEEEEEEEEEQGKPRRARR
jgi:hypothetical protein